MTHPDIAFQKIRSGKAVAKKLFDEVVTWEGSTDLDKLNAWCLLFLQNDEYFERITKNIAVILSSGNRKAIINCLLVLMYSSDRIIMAPRIKKATRHAFLTGDVSSRINATRVLAAQKNLGDATAKKLLLTAMDDPDAHVRDNATVFLK